MNFGLRQLNYFVAIAEAGSFREASERTFTAQPALSVSIRKLEEALDTQLLKRGTRGVTLTPAGEAFLVEARRSLLHADLAQEAARRTALGQQGMVKLGFVGSAVYQLLPSRLPAFVARYPGIRLELTESATVSIIEMIREGRLDAGIIRTPAVVDTHGLQIVDIETDDLVAVLPATHQLAKNKSIALAALCDEAFVMFSQAQVPGLRTAVFDVCRAAGFVPRIAQDAVQAISVVGLVGSGLGVALVPSVVARYSSTQIRFVRLTDESCCGRSTLSLVSSGADLSEAVKNFCIAIASPQQ